MNALTCKEHINLEYFIYTFYKMIIIVLYVKA